MTDLDYLLSFLDSQSLITLAGDLVQQGYELYEEYQADVLEKDEWIAENTQLMRVYDAVEANIPAGSLGITRAWTSPHDVRAVIEFTPRGLSACDVGACECHLTESR